MNCERTRSVAESSYTQSRLCKLALPSDTFEYRKVSPGTVQPCARNERISTLCWYAPVVVGNFVNDLVDKYYY